MHDLTVDYSILYVVTALCKYFGVLLPDDERALTYEWWAVRSKIQTGWIKIPLEVCWLVNMQAATPHNSNELFHKRGSAPLSCTVSEVQLPSLFSPFFWYARIPCLFCYHHDSSPGGEGMDGSGWMGRLLFNHLHTYSTIKAIQLPEQHRPVDTLLKANGLHFICCFATNFHFWLLWKQNVSDCASIKMHLCRNRQKGQMHVTQDQQVWHATPNLWIFLFQFVTHPHQWHQSLLGFGWLKQYHFNVDEPKILMFWASLVPVKKLRCRGESFYLRRGVLLKDSLYQA